MKTPFVTSVAVPRRSVLALAVALSLAGCINLAPDYQRPAAPVAAGFPTVNTPVANAPAISWQQFFGDARLRRIIEIALKNNRDLRIAVLNIEQARAQFQVRRADQLPNLSAGVTGSRTPGANGSINSTYTAGFIVPTFELDFFGRVKNLSDAALAQYLATEDARQNVQISLIASVANAYLATLADEEQLALTRVTLTTREQSYQLIRLKYDAGVVSELDLRQAESLVEAARVALAAQQRQRAQDENLLTVLAGQTLPADLPPVSSLAAVLAGTELPVGLPSEVLVKRPDVRQAEEQLIAANANVGAARAAFFPHITLTGTAGSASNALSGLFKAGSYAWTFAPQMVLPLFDAGRNSANLDSARAGREIAVAQYEKAVQTAFREVADALAGRATFGEQLRAQVAQADAESVRYKLSDLRYKNGAASFLDLLDAQRSLFAAQQAAIQTRLLQLQNQVGLYKALGGGWN
jgi:NodT family efflux transporter outer membrane factor (OMF) lipoprotein